MKDFRCIVYMILIGAAFWFVVIPRLELVVFDYVPPQIPPETKLGEWKASFQYWARVVAVAACLMSIVWYILGQWCFKLNKVKDAGKRLWWGLLGLVTIAFIIVAFMRLAQAESGPGLYLAYLFFFLNAFVCYYLLTLLFSPPSFKYTPVGASAIRRW